MEMEELKWSMDEFLEKASDFAPTLVLIRLKNGTECGGVAGVPWPKTLKIAADPAKGSFIFSLGATPARFDLVESERALHCRHTSFVFGYDSSDLYVTSGGVSGSRDEGDYAGATGRRDRRHLVPAVGALGTMASVNYLLFLTGGRCR
jgi:hypothetical protein